MNFQEALREKTAFFEKYLRETITKGENRRGGGAAHAGSG
jgi:hypothetical protein